MNSRLRTFKSHVQRPYTWGREVFARRQQGADCWTWQNVFSNKLQTLLQSWKAIYRIYIVVFFAPRHHMTQFCHWVWFWVLDGISLSIQQLSRPISWHLWPQSWGNYKDGVREQAGAHSAPEKLGPNWLKMLNCWSDPIYENKQLRETFFLFSSRCQPGLQRNCFWPDSSGPGLSGRNLIIRHLIRRNAMEWGETSTKQIMVRPSAKAKQYTFGIAVAWSVKPDGTVEAC